MTFDPYMIPHIHNSNATFKIGFLCVNTLHVLADMTRVMVLI